jgi:transcriptional regulator with XRE-family HTH domain
LAKAKKTVTPRSTTNADAELGEKIRTRRLSAGMSQSELGNALGVTFQQVQKYEKGVNRVSATRLEEVAGALGESVSYFQAGEALSKAGRELQSLLSDPLNLRICKALRALPNQPMRFQFVRLLESVSGIAGDE